MDNSINKQLSVIILAAGMGKRMNDSTKPKVMALIDEKPLIGHVLDNIKNLDIFKNVVIVGHKKELVIDYLQQNYTNIICVEQKVQLGTGHAVEQAVNEFNNFDGNILILCGDVPNLSSKAVSNLIDKHISAVSDVSVLTTLAPNPNGYGRIIRNVNNDFIKIVEEKDANEFEKNVNEINSGVYVVNSKLLFGALKEISNENAQGEYYLTDIITILRNKGYRVEAFAVADFDELLGVNSHVDLEKATNYYFNTIKK